MDASPSLRGFFDRYSAASLGSSPELLAGMYAPTFIVGGPHGSKAFPNDTAFLDWLRQVHEFNCTHGMNALEAGAIDERVLSPLHTLATVRWAARFARSGERRIEFSIAYLLERAGETWRILSYISEQDQDEAMRKEGLL